MEIPVESYTFPPTPPSTLMLKLHGETENLGIVAAVYFRAHQRYKVTLLRSHSRVKQNGGGLPCEANSLWPLSLPSPCPDKCWPEALSLH